MSSEILPEQLEELTTLSTPTVVNALKQLGVEPPEIETTDGSVQCISPELGVVVGFVATARVCISDMRPSGADDSALRKKFLEHIVEQRDPRILVVENVATPVGRGCFWGEVQANLHRALGAVAGLTNGPVRDITEMSKAGFMTFAAGVAVGGAYHSHVEVGGTVEVAGLTARPGELLHGDRHGIVKVPADLAPRVPAAAREVADFEGRVLKVVRRPDFELADLPTIAGVRH